MTTRHTLAACLFLLVAFGVLALVPSGGGTTVEAQGAAGWPEMTLTRVAGGLRWPVHVTHAGDGSGRLFVVEKEGRIRILRRGLLLEEPFLDITARVRSEGYEEGMLSVAFPPDYERSGLFYVFYTNLDGDNVVARFKVSAAPNRADPASWSLVLYISHPFHDIHNGGQLAFGPRDGYLYVGTGDGGGMGGPEQSAQSKSWLLGKILRIDVSTPGPQPPGMSPPLAGQCDPGGAYRIPPTNPFTQTVGACGEIWALGFRNPWRFSFDRRTGGLYIGDVGESMWEEIDYQPASSPGGENYGWHIMEGNHCFDTRLCCQPIERYVPPIAEFSHAQSRLPASVTGGFVYRGDRSPDLDGIYLYADFRSGRIWGLRPTEWGWEGALLMDERMLMSSFGEDEDGELYLTRFSESQGVVFLISGRSADTSPNPTPTPAAWRQRLFLPLTSLGTQGCGPAPAGTPTSGFPGAGSAFRSGGRIDASARSSIE